MVLCFCAKCGIRMIVVKDEEEDLVDKCPNCDMTPEEFNKLNRIAMSR